jgi:methylmalonyl-CoA mutase cobalamin-binding subunit
VEKGAVLLFYYSDAVFGSTQCESGMLRVTLADTVDSDEEIATTALDTKTDCFVICDYYGAYAQAMGRYGCEHKYV